MSSSLVTAWLSFAACAALIGAGGFQLSRHGDAIAQRTGLSGSWIGMTLVASVTSLPELATGLTSVTWAQAPNLAVGNALGSCVLNLAFLVLIDLLVRDEPVWRRARTAHVLAAALGAILLGVTLLAMLVAQLPSSRGAPAVSVLVRWTHDAGIGLVTPLVLGLYLLAMRTVWQQERAEDAAAPPTAPGCAAPAAPPLARSAAGFGLAALVVVGAGLWLPFVATDLAAAMGWNRSFVGSLFMALATTLPELAVTLSALRLGALDMAIGNLLGSNLFNVTILAIEDLFYRPGVLLAHVSPVHAVTATSALVMTGLALLGLYLRPPGRVLRAVGAVSVALLAVYLLNTLVIYLHGD